MENKLKMQFQPIVVLGKKATAGGEILEDNQNFYEKEFTTVEDLEPLEVLQYNRALLVDKVRQSKLPMIQNESAIIVENFTEGEVVIITTFTLVDGKLKADSKTYYTNDYKGIKL